MRNHWRDLRQKYVIRLRIDRIRAARANFFHIAGPIFGIKKARA